MKWQRRICIIIGLTILIAMSTVQSAVASPSLGEPAIAARAAVLFEQGSGKVLYSKSSEQRMYPASLTKLLSALVAMEHGGNLEQVVVAGEELRLVRPNSSVVGLRQRDRVGLQDLLRGMLLSSGNDAAYVVAVHTGRASAKDPELPVSQALARFIDMMNQTAKNLGAANSQFVNPDGYHDDRHYSTASDLALIARRAMQNQFLRQVVSQDQVTVSFVRQGQQMVASYRNTNRLLDPSDNMYYPQAIGLKTGTTLQAGHCLAAAASANQLNLIAVILDSTKTGRFSDAHQLLDYGFSEYQFQPLCQVGDPQLTARLSSRVPGFSANVTLVSRDEVGVVVKRGDATGIVEEFIWEPSLVDIDDDRIVISAKATAGEVIGRHVFRLGQQRLAEVPLVFAATGRYRPSAAIWLLLLAILGMAVKAMRWRKKD